MLDVQLLKRSNRKIANNFGDKFKMTILEIHIPPCLIFRFRLSQSVVHGKVDVTFGGIGGILLKENDRVCVGY